MQPILIVDDDLTIREFLSEALENEGYSTLSAENGLQALEVVRTRTCSLIVLDIRMPVLDGYGFLEAYQQLAVEQAPVLAISANKLVLHEVPPGAAAVIAKPFNLQSLLSAIENLLSSRKAR
jgi:CheY-like chemotaxis protein